ncbi:photosynthetic complex assembly protein [Alphaproteobacteria bacterium GH1-50]|uniref:Photosynthetic complex assembly protein n=2 Tax=Kangsaoukella pontilimi TaxID=2691042 RepID=A0A7C9IJ38_9RHOB|nr:photosynthetic complex assembly protein [Kangsaoukella pontilimi]
MERRDRELIPRRLVIAMFSLAIAVVLLVSFAVITDRPLVGQPKAAPIFTERFLVLDPAGKAMRVTDANTGDVVLNVDNGGFVSVVTDGLERARIVHGTEGNPPVKLTLYQNGRLSLFDTGSGWSMELSSFGPGNRGVWLELLK